MTIVTNRPVRSKYNCNTIEKIFQNVAKRRERMFEDELDHHEQRFRSEKGVCGTFVTSFRKAPAAPHRSAAESKLVIIRSYDNTRRGRTLKSQADSQGQPHRLPGPKSPALQRSDTTGLSRQARHQQREGRPNIAGTSYRWQVWEVARAATAADFFFDPFEIEGQDSREKVIYTDAGLDHNNNPVREAVEEIEDLAGPNSLGIVVSVGTARGQKKSKMTISAKLKSMIDEKTDPEVNHRWAEDKFEVKSGHHRHYFRLNHPGALEIELDEWLPRKHWYNRPERAAGSDTVEKIRNKFNEWAGSAESTRQLRECAEKLVRRRRARASKPTLGKWEHFATCIKINCYGRRCNETFRNRDDFMRHIQDGQMHPDEKDESKEEIDWRLKEYGWTTRWIYQAPR
ncbi:MAG: hypothetical protein M1820_001590 [Bogoriella megaspora]|nr:MAG: hypothetical protein M1820_001590 [Bogoriella megaspora]